MILHLGGNIAVQVKDIIALFDLNSAQLSEINKEFLSIAREEGFVKEVCNGDYKTFILAETNNKTAIYLSPISVATLRKRSGMLQL